MNDILTISSLTPPTTVLRTLGKRLAAARKQRGFTQTDLAEKAGIGVATLRRIEGGSDSQMESWIKLLGALELIDGIESLLPANIRSPMSDAKKANKKSHSQQDGWGDEKE